MDEINASLNDNIIVYPTEKGVAKMYEDLRFKFESMRIEDEELTADKVLDSCKTNDGGFEFQLWRFANFFGYMLYNGTDYFKTQIKIIQNG